MTKAKKFAAFRLPDCWLYLCCCPDAASLVHNLPWTSTSHAVDIEQQMLNMANGPASTNNGEQTGPKTTVYLANDKGLLAPCRSASPKPKTRTA